LQLDVVSGELVVVGTSEFVHKLFKTWRAFEVNEFPAFDTDKVMMVCFERLSELVALFETDLNDVNDTEFGKELQRPVDARALGELACL
jgi:hypothetical protein